MNRTQWYILGIFFILLGMWFSFLNNSVWKQTCSDSISNYEVPATTFDVFACIRSEMFVPFVWIFYPLGIVFLILGWLEPKEKKK